MPDLFPRANPSLQGWREGAREGGAPMTPRERLLDHIALPQWALNEGARAQLEQIIRERPEPSIGDAMGFKVAHYRATSSASPVAQLRRLYRDWLDAECRALDAAFHATGVYDQEASNAVFRTEDCDKLIARILRETANVVPYSRMSIKTLPSGGSQVAA